MVRKATILLLRPRDRLARSLRLCRALGLRVIAAPALEPRGLTPHLPRRVDVAVFTSRRAVESLPALSPLRGAEVWSIGPETCRALRERGARARLPPLHSSAGLLRALAPRVRGKRVLLLRSRQGDPALVRGLRAAGASVTDVALYTLERPRNSAALGRAARAAASGGIDIFAFTSAGTARNFLDAARREGLERRVKSAMRSAVVAALGEPTRRELGRRGVRVDFVPRRADFAALVRGGLAAHRARVRASPPSR